MDPSLVQGLFPRDGSRQDCERISGLSVGRYRRPGPDGICALPPHRFLGPEGLYPFQVSKERGVPVVPSCCLSPCSYGREPQSSHSGHVMCVARQRVDTEPESSSKPTGSGHSCSPPRHSPDWCLADVAGRRSSSFACPSSQPREPPRRAPHGPRVHADSGHHAS